MKVEDISPALILANCKSIKCSVIPELSYSLHVFFRLRLLKLNPYSIRFFAIIKHHFRLDTKNNISGSHISVKSPVNYPRKKDF